MRHVAGGTARIGRWVIGKPLQAVGAEHTVKQVEAKALGTKTQAEHHRSENHFQFHLSHSPLRGKLLVHYPVPALAVAWLRQR